MKFSRLIAVLIFVFTLLPVQAQLTAKVDFRRDYISNLKDEKGVNGAFTGSIMMYF